MDPQTMQPEVETHSMAHRYGSEPGWVPDETYVKCYGCLRPFTVLRRRHHCRDCGHLFCRRCSKPTPRDGKKTRVCGTCEQEWTQEQKVQSKAFEGGHPTRVRSLFDPVPDRGSARVAMEVDGNLFVGEAVLEDRDACLCHGKVEQGQGTVITWINGTTRVTLALSPHEPTVVGVRVSTPMHEYTGTQMGQIETVCIHGSSLYLVSDIRLLCTDQTHNNTYSITIAGSVLWSGAVSTTLHGRPLSFYRETFDTVRSSLAAIRSTEARLRLAMASPSLEPLEGTDASALFMSTLETRNAVQDQERSLSEAVDLASQCSVPVAVPCRCGHPLLIE